MSNSSKRFRKITVKTISSIFLCSTIFLTGCGYSNIKTAAGTTVETGAISVDAKDGQSDVTWFNGQKICNAQITVSDYFREIDIDLNYDSSFIPTSDLMTLYCLKITSDSDISDLYDMQILDDSHNVLYYTGETYDGAVYHLSNDYYGFLLPNGYDKPIVMKIGNVYYPLSYNQENTSQVSTSASSEN